MSNEIIRVQPLTKTLISELVATLWSSTKTYGKQLDGAALQGWVMLTALDEVTEPEFTDGIRRFMRQTDFPTPSEFCKWVLEKREWRESRDRMRGMAELFREEDERRHREYLAQHPERENWTVEDYRTHLHNLFAEMDAKMTRPLPREG